MSSTIARSPAPREGSAYGSDLHAWAREQAQLIRAGRFDAVDLDNVAEEIESLGKSTRSQLQSRLATLIEHLLKLDAPPSPGPRRQWRGTVRRSRLGIERVLRDNPSLRREVGLLLAEVQFDAVQLAAGELEDAGEFAAAAHVRSQEGAPFTDEELFGDWYPGATRSRPERDAV